MLKHWIGSGNASKALGEIVIDRRTPRADTRWWGWGLQEVEVSAGERVRELLVGRGLLSTPEGTPFRKSIDQVQLPEARPLPEEVEAAAGSDSVFIDSETRIRHATGQSLLDLLKLREGILPAAPDAVVLARNAAQIEAILSAASSAGVGVIPYGGGTSVTGGVTPPSDVDRPLLSLDTSGLVDSDLDATSRTARLGAGLRGPEAESALGRDGFTLGHFPQSWEFGTIGGFAATRSAGQSSNGYGRFDEMVLGATIVTPAGTIETPSIPHSSEGPSLLDFVLGSEGVLGVITEVEVAVRPVPETTYEAWIMPDFPTGVGMVRELAQDGPLPAVVRLSDEPETSLNLALSGPTGLVGTLFEGYLGLRGVSEGSLLLLGYEGDLATIRSERTDVGHRLARVGGLRLGRRAGRAWERDRFHGPYLREGLLDLGLVVETFETAAPWSGYESAHAELSRVTSEEMDRQGMAGELLCHLSHAYPDAASIYFTVVASPGPEGAAASWMAVKAAALEKMRELGLPVSHHHGIGRDHREEFAVRTGEVGLRAIEGLRATVDPAGIMNPGCLLEQTPLHTP